MKCTNVAFTVGRWLLAILNLPGGRVEFMVNITPTSTTPPHQTLAITRATGTEPFQPYITGAVMVASTKSNQKTKWAQN
jgi:hypothetical protein